MESAWIGLAGLLIGVLLGEYFHRNKRIEIYSQKVFDKRLSVHEELYKIFLESNELDAISVRSKVYESAKITKKMILEEAGVTEVFKHFSTISKSKPNSAVIRYFRRLRN